MRISRPTLVVLTTIILTGTLGLNLIVFSLYSSYIRIPSSGSLSDFTSPLHVEGKYIKDDYGRVVYLRGITKGQHLAVPGGWWHPEGSMNDYGYGLWLPNAVRYNLDKMKEFGFTCLRIFLPDVQRWLADEDDINCGVTTRDRIAYVVDQANQRGIYVILCPWAVADPYGGQTGIPWDPYTKPSERGILTGPEDFIDFWAGPEDSLSVEYGRFPNVIYELWNEPNGWSPDVDLQGLYFNYCQEIVSRLRAKGDEHIVIYMFGYTGLNSNNAVSWGQMLNGTNVVYGSHVYRTLGGPTRWTPYFDGHYNYEDVKEDLLNNTKPQPEAMFIQNIIDNDLPLIMTEFGCLMNGPLVEGDIRENELTWYGNVMRCLNEWGFGYTAFVWRSDSDFAVFEDNSVQPWLPPLNAAGEIIRNSIAAGKT